MPLQPRKLICAGHKKYKTINVANWESLSITVQPFSIRLCPAKQKRGLCWRRSVQQRQIKGTRRHSHKFQSVLVRFTSLSSPSATVLQPMQRQHKCFDSLVDWTASSSAFICLLIWHDWNKEPTQCLEKWKGSGAGSDISASCSEESYTCLAKKRFYSNVTLLWHQNLVNTFQGEGFTFCVWRLEWSRPLICPKFQLKQAATDKK